MTRNVSSVRPLDLSAALAARTVQNARYVREGVQAELRGQWLRDDQVAAIAPEIEAMRQRERGAASRAFMVEMDAQK
jgi:hypothetical protein